MKKILLPFLGLNLLMNVCQAQTAEIPMEPSNIMTLITPFSEKKSLMVAYTDGYENNKRDEKYFYEYYDHNLKKLGSGNYTVDLKTGYFFKISTEDAYYQLYRNFKTDMVTVYKFNFTTNQFETKNVQFPENCGRRVKEAMAIGDKLYFSYRDAETIQLLVYDSNTGTLKSVDVKKGDALLTFADMQICNGQNSQKEIQLKCFKKGKPNALAIFVFDLDGVLKTTEPVLLPEIDSKTKRKTTSFAKLKDGSYMVVGTYSRDLLEASNGIFITKLKDGKQVEFEKVYNYLEFPNFTAGLSNNEKQKQERYLAKKESGGREINIDYNTVNHDIIEKGGRFYLVSEFYKDIHRVVYSTDGITKQVFNGYIYTHAQIACFDGSGKVLWSNTFPVYYQHYGLINNVDVSFEGDHIKLGYIDTQYSSTVTFSIDGRIMDQQKKKVRETLQTTGKDVKSENELTYWFDNVSYITTTKLKDKHTNLLTIKKITN